MKPLTMTPAILRALHTSHTEAHGEWHIVLAADGYGVEPTHPGFDGVMDTVTGPSVLSGVDLAAAMPSGWSDEIADEIAATFPTIPAEVDGADPETADVLVIAGHERPGSTDHSREGCWWTDRSTMARVDDMLSVTAAGQWVNQYRAGWVGQERAGWWEAITPEEAARSAYRSIINGAELHRVDDEELPALILAAVHMARMVVALEDAPDPDRQVTLPGGIVRVARPGAGEYVTAAEATGIISELLRTTVSPALAVARGRQLDGLVRLLGSVDEAAELVGMRPDSLSRARRAGRADQ